jgi:hypothetical protein
MTKDIPELNVKDMIQQWINHQENKPLNSTKEKRRNKRFSSKRTLGERPFAVIKTVFKNAHVTTITRTSCEKYGIMICYNTPTTKHNPKKRECSLSDSSVKF